MCDDGKNMQPDKKSSDTYLAYVALIDISKFRFFYILNIFYVDIFSYTYLYLGAR